MWPPGAFRSGGRKLKTLLRRASERSIEALWNRIGELLDRFPQNECENYFKADGTSFTWMRPHDGGSVSSTAT